MFNAAAHIGGATTEAMSDDNLFRLLSKPGAGAVVPSPASGEDRVFFQVVDARPESKPQVMTGHIIKRRTLITVKRLPYCFCL
jgi:hypothetical protein